METPYALLTVCAWKPPATDGSPHKAASMRIFGVFFVASIDKQGAKDLPDRIWMQRTTCIRKLEYNKTKLLFWSQSRQLMLE